MKKIICLMIAFSCFMLGHAQAATMTQKAWGTQTAVGTNASSDTYYPTDITITNYSSRFIDIYVPVLHFAQRLYPHYVQHVVAYDGDYKRVILYDYNGITFFDRLVGNHEGLDVYDRMGKNYCAVH